MVQISGLLTLTQRFQLDIERSVLNEDCQPNVKDFCWANRSNGSKWTRKRFTSKKKLIV